jgi:hypothetical protein
MSMWIAMAIISRRYKCRLPPSLVIIPDLRGVAFCNNRLRGARSLGELEDS